MNLVLYTHPAFLGSHSHQHFARMLVSAYRARGHSVELRQPKSRVHGRVGAGLAKWGGYVDQYLIFPLEMRRAMRGDAADTLHVFCDQALGPWIPAVLDRPHVVHCHDLMALRSALGDIPENPTSASGRLYQRYIRRGFRHARHFISVSEKSRADLHRFGGVDPLTSRVVHNGLNHPYRALAPDQARLRLQRAGLPVGDGRCLLHVGGGQWYKNGAGVVHLYARHVAEALRSGSAVPALWMISPPPGEALRAAIAEVPAPGRVRFFSGIDDATLEAAYSWAEALLFPSLAEGFGWPIVEALACGCPVITTAEPPMSEIGGPVAHYLPRLARAQDLEAWTAQGARLLARVLSRSMGQRQRDAAEAIAWARQFDGESAIDSYLAIYRLVLDIETARQPQLQYR